MDRWMDESLFKTKIKEIYNKDKNIIFIKE